VLFASLGPSASTPQMASCSVQPFLHSSRQKVPLLYNWLPISPQKLSVSMGSGPPSSTWFLGPTQVYSPTSISSGSAVLQCSQSQQTDHATPSVTVGCIYVRSTRMRSRNSSLLTECRVLCVAVRVFFGERCKTSVTRAARSATTTKTVTLPFLRATAASIAD